MSSERILIAGAGGQGIVFIGKLLANAAISSTPHITFFPSYGAEVRGGDSSCQVILSTREISSPVSREFDLMIVMNPASTAKFRPQLAPDGVAIVNSSLARGTPCPCCVMVPATEEADRLGDQRVANLIMLGTLLAHRRIVDPAQIEMLLRNLLAGNPVILARNLAAFNAGLAYTA